MVHGKNNIRNIKMNKKILTDLLIESWEKGLEDYQKTIIETFSEIIKEVGDTKMLLSDVIKLIDECDIKEKENE
jgi:hypothetical protein